MKKRGLLLLLIGLCSFSIAYGGALLPFKRVDLPTEKKELTAGQPVFRQGRAKEDFLHLKRDKTYGLPKAALPADQVDTISIIAIRVDFKPENPDDPNTTGTGVFDLRDTTTFLQQEHYALDPAPHNKNYFSAHLRSMTHYWEVVSNGKLHFEYEVWPAAIDSSYHLDSAMAYYGSRDPNSGLGAFFHDAIRKAYSIDSGGLDFRDARGRKKAVILFHAGADRQTNLSFSATDTPYDLYTGFATFDSANWVKLAQDTVVEGVIMPETMTQDNRITCMNSVMAHEFGHQLGLVDIYNTGSNPPLSEVGNFELMDNNASNVGAQFDNYGVTAFGTVPVFPSAWSRAFLGFDDVVEYKEGTNIPLAAVYMRTNKVKIAKIPITSTEYYLLENRRSDITHEVEGLQQDKSTNVILWPARRDQLIDSIIYPVPQYDLYLPEGTTGIAVWHVDEMAATMNYDPYSGFTNNFDANTLQWDRFRRFLSIEEADGNIEFGGNYQSGTGVKEDLFYQGNNTQFSDFTNPPAISHDQGYTHIKISNISAPDTVMTFDVTREQMASGYPRRVAIPSNPNLPPVAARLNSAGNLDSTGSEVIFAVSKNKLLAIRTDGRDFLDTLGAYPDNDTLIDVLKATTAVNNDRPIDTAFAPMPVFADVVGQVSTSPVVAQFRPDTTVVSDTTIVLVGTSLGSVFSYLPSANSSGIPGIYRAQLFHIVAAGGAGAVKQILPDYANGIIRIIYANDDIVSAPWDTTANFPTIDSTYRWHFSGTAVGACRIAHGLAYLIENDSGSILYQLRDVSPANARDSFVQASQFIPEKGFHAPVATDFERDGVDEVVLLSRSGHILSYHLSTTGITPYSSFDIHTGDTAAAGPALADFEGNGHADLIVPGTNKIYAYAWNGVPVNDFPLSIDNGYPGQFVITSPLVTDIDGDGRPDIVAATFDSLTHTRTIAARIIDNSVVPPDTTDTTLTYYYYNYFSRIYVLSPGQFRVAGSPYEAGAFGIRRLEDTVIGVATPLHLKSGAAGLLVTMGADGWLNAWTCGWNNSRAQWPMAHRTPDGSGYFPLDSIGADKPLADFLPKARFFGYPNPAIGDKTTIRFYLSQPAAVTLTIFDALGDKVWETALDIPAGNQDNDVVWNVHDVASGVYHCRIKAVARSGGQEAVVIKPIAVVK